MSNSDSFFGEDFAIYVEVGVIDRVDSNLLSFILDSSLHTKLSTSLCFSQIFKCSVFVGLVQASYEHFTIIYSGEWSTYSFRRTILHFMSHTCYESDMSFIYLLPFFYLLHYII